MVNRFPGFLAFCFLAPAALLGCRATAPLPVAVLSKEEEARVAELGQLLEARIAAVEAEVPQVDGGGPPPPLSDEQVARFAKAWNGFWEVVVEVRGLYSGPPGTTPDAIHRLRLQVSRLCWFASGPSAGCPSEAEAKELPGVMARNIQQSRQREAELEAVGGLYHLAHRGPGFAPVACPDGRRAKPRDTLGRGGCRFIFQMEGFDSQGQPSGVEATPAEPFIALAYGVAAPVTGVRYRVLAPYGLAGGILLERLGGEEPQLLPIRPLKRPGSGKGEGTADAVKEAPEVMGFTDEMTRPSMVSGYDPVYTLQALEARTQGLFIVKCIIDTAGNVDHCRVIKPLPDMEMAVLGAITSRRYKPVTYRGKAISCDYVFVIKLVAPQRR